MRSSIDFLKIDNGNLGAINFNNMIPVTDDNIIYLDLDDKPKNKKKLKYYKLLTEQLFWLNRNDVKVFKRSKDLYDKYKNKDYKLKLWRIEHERQSEKRIRALCFFL